MIRRVALTLALLAGCKDGSKAKPAQGSATAAPATAAHMSDTHARPELPAQAPTGASEDSATAATGHPAAPAVLPDSIDSMRKRFDSNHDGKLTPDELAKNSRFDDPAAVDTNGDGEVSRTELEAAMRERRQQWRRDHRGSGSGGAM